MLRSYIEPIALVPEFAIRTPQVFDVNNLKFAEKKSEVKFSTFVVRKIRFNRLAEVNSVNNKTSKSIGGIRPLSVKLKDTE